MGTIWLPPNQFAAFFGEQLGFKSGLALTREEMVDHLGATDPVAPAIASVSDEPIPLRADDIDDAFQRLLHKLGRLPQSFVGHAPTLLNIKYQKDPESHALFERVLDLLCTVHFDRRKISLSGDGFDKRAFYERVAAELPASAESIAIELVELTELSELASPWAWYPARQVEWKDLAQLNDLFASESLSTLHGTYIDQRFVDYLSANFERIDEIHWRKFEALAAEFLVRCGYDVAVGPGRDDGGVDVRAWNAGHSPTEPPILLVQCKRQRNGVGKAVVKALWADVVHEHALRGLIVTSSALSPGADTMRRARSYPIKVADRSTVRAWLNQMRTPGKGVFLGS